MWVWLVVRWINEVPFGSVYQTETAPTCEVSGGTENQRKVPLVFCSLCVVLVGWLNPAHMMPAVCPLLLSRSPWSAPLILQSSCPAAAKLVTNTHTRLDVR